MCIDEIHPLRQTIETCTTAFQPIKEFKFQMETKSALFRSNETLQPKLQHRTQCIESV